MQRYDVKYINKDVNELKKKIILFSVLVLAAVTAVIALTVFKKADNAEEKNIKVTVIFADSSEKIFDIKTKAEFLGKALLDEKIITQAEYSSGFYTEICGVKADFAKDEAWWCVLKGGEMTDVGINKLALDNGDEFTLKYTVG